MTYCQTTNAGRPSWVCDPTKNLGFALQKQFNKGPTQFSIDNGVDPIQFNDAPHVSIRAPETILKSAFTNKYDQQSGSNNQLDPMMRGPPPKMTPNLTAGHLNIRKQFIFSEY